MLLTISFTFLATTLPLTVVSIAAAFVGRTGGPDALTASRFELARTIAELLMYANHAINFYLYCAVLPGVLLSHVLCSSTRCSSTRCTVLLSGLPLPRWFLLPCVFLHDESVTGVLLPGVLPGVFTRCTVFFYQAFYYQVYCVLPLGVLMAGVFYHI